MTMPSPAVATRARLSYLGLALLAGAVCAWSAWLVIPHFTFRMDGITVSIQEAHGLCNTALTGPYGPLYSQAAAGCGQLALAYDVLAALFWGGLALAVAGVVTLARRAVRVAGRALPEGAGLLPAEAHVQDHEAFSASAGDQTPRSWL